MTGSTAVNRPTLPDRTLRNLLRGAAAFWFLLCGAFVATPWAATPMPAGANSAKAEARKSRIAWTEPRFVYQANGKRLVEVLQDFAASQGLPSIMAEGVEGVVHGSFDTTPDAFLNAITKSYGTVWYHDGTALYFYPARAMQSRMFRLKGFTRRQVEQMMSSLNLGDLRYPLRFNTGERTLMAYGPPRHIELVSAALDSLDAGATERNLMMVRVFPLRYAVAADRRHGNTMVPGLVTVLRGIYGGTLNSPEAVGQEALGASRITSKMQAMRATSGTTRLIPEIKGKVEGDPQAPAGAAQRGLRSPVNDDDMPWFEAETGTNAIVVRGRLQRMAEYGYLIRRLDRRPTLVELEATIIDVNADSVEALGIDWSARGGKGAISVKPTVGEQTVGAASATGGFVVNTLWANAGRELLARIEMLRSQGQARIIAKPKVLGVANRPAVMQEKRSAAVRVAGNLDAQLYQVEAGTLLEVTPQVTEIDGITRMKLSLYIEDGQFEARLVDNVPIVKRMEIRTEAHVVEGESLLVGGITIEAQSSNGGGVPGLSRIPVLGALFRWDGDRSMRSERLFLITPKLVRDIDHLPPPADNEFEGFQPEVPAPPKANTKVVER